MEEKKLEIKISKILFLLFDIFEGEEFYIVENGFSRVVVGVIVWIRVFIRFRYK